MSAFVVTEVRKGFYLDSVALMRMSQTIVAMDGVQEAALMMGTPSNLQIMADANLLSDPQPGAGGGDLLIGIRADTSEAAKGACQAALEQLDKPVTGSEDGEAWRPRTLRAAVKVLPAANLALISVPGDFAIAEARKAIRRGLHVMIFSDNVDLTDEAELKREARDLGCLVMGPDCGTAIINGTPLAFANKTPRGDIGIVGASGTGTQEVSCLIAQDGGGISHAIGVGGRDLKSEVGGITTLMAIDALDEDPGTRQIVLISKPPPADVATLVLDRVGASKKPFVICFIGADKLPMPSNAIQVFTLKAAAQAAQGADMDTANETPIPSAFSRPKRVKRVQGLFSGGTLCAEAQVIFMDAGQTVTSNAPIPGVDSIDETNDGHSLLDLGDDQYTQGKPHPMIDPSVREPAFVAALQDENIAVVLADVVIGYGAHNDPAGHLAQLMRAHGRADGPTVIVSVTGTEQDPQTRSIQIATLQAAGIHVAPTNADAAAWALAAIDGKN